MKIAEALARRRDITNRTQRDYAAEVVGAVIHEEGDSVETGGDYLTNLSLLLDEVERISIQINTANNQTSIEFDGRTMTLMAAIVLRDSYAREIACLTAIKDGIEQAIGRGRHAYYSRRNRDEVKVVTDLPVATVRNRLDRFQGQLRRLDIEIQKENWSLD